MSIAAAAGGSDAKPRAAKGIWGCWPLKEVFSRSCVSAFTTLHDTQGISKCLGHLPWSAWSIVVQAWFGATGTGQDLLLKASGSGCVGLFSVPKGDAVAVSLLSSV